MVVKLAMTIYGLLNNTIIEVLVFEGLLKAIRTHFPVNGNNRFDSANKYGRFVNRWFETKTRIANNS